MSSYFSNIHISDTQISHIIHSSSYIYINTAVSCKRYPPSLPYIITVQTCGKRWDLPKFVNVLSVNLGFSQSLIYIYILRFYIYIDVRIYIYISSNFEHLYFLLGPPNGYSRGFKIIRGWHQLRNVQDLLHHFSWHSSWFHERDEPQPGKQRMAHGLHILGFRVAFQGAITTEPLGNNRNLGSLGLGIIYWYPMCAFRVYFQRLQVVRE